MDSNEGALEEHQVARSRGDSESERGAALVEYVVLIGLIAITVIFSINLFAVGISRTFWDVGNSIQATVPVQGDDDESTDTDDDHGDDRQDEEEEEEEEEDDD